MSRHARSSILLVAALSAAVCAFALPEDEQPTAVFKSDVSLVRVDAQVLDHSGRAITGLRPEDFLVYEEGKQQQIRNFAAENMPVDVLFLIDVSGSMQPHVERLANAAHQALSILAEGDRVGIMVFDRSTRVRLRLTPGPTKVAYEFDRIMQDEHFNGGTDITRGMLDAASYMAREGRKDARKAIVILTDDETERERDDARVMQALTRADAVMMALIAPDAMMSGRFPRGGGGYPQGGRYPQGGGYPQGGNYPGGGYPGGGYPGGRRGGLGGIILGGPMGGPMGGGWPGGGGGGRWPQGGNYPMGGRTHTAGTAEIARQSGGESSNIDDSRALEDTLERIRNRYALYFYLPSGAKPGTERSIEVALASSARQRYQGADVRYRQRYLAPGAGGSGADATDAEPVIVSQGNDSGSNDSQQRQNDNRPGLRRRRPAVDDTGGSRGPDAGTGGGWRKSDDPADQRQSTTSPQPTQPDAPAPAVADSNRNPAPDPQPAQPQQEQKGGWRRVKPGEQP